ncbi:MAG: two pore domain potassium channel family protein [Planctomycetes bacterium]|nr:two pore domain potassium channel family protein [Planctomycetota bacterium]
MLFVSLMLLVLSRTALPQNFLDSLIGDILGALLVAASMITICDERRYRIFAVALGGPVVLILGTAFLFPGKVPQHLQFLGHVASFFFLSFTVAMLVRSVLMAPIVTWDTVIGAFSGYVLIGVVWTQLFCAIDIVDKQAFTISGEPFPEHLTPIQRHGILEYFSFTTLSTVGYGDIVPVSQSVRGLSTFEAICGQFYLAVLVAGLIGIRTTPKKSPPPPDEQLHG